MSADDAPMPWTPEDFRDFYNERAGIFLMLRWIPWLTLTRVALILNLLGTGLLAFSFVATSSDFRLITAPDTNVYGKPAPGSTAYAICVQNYSVAITDAHGVAGMGVNNCPNWDKSSPAAVVVAEHPGALWLGLVLSALGFLIQLLAPVPSAAAVSTLDPPMTRVERRRILKERGDI
jgi:hypothetical protein